MSANQAPTRRPKPVTQRDGSELQYANCRMGSVSTGLDFHTRGSKTSTAGKMRSFTTDQSGGTDSGDARQAWSRGFKQTLRVMDGKPFSEVIASLKAGRGVNLDVWHSTVGGPCLSGSGRYGHNMFILPDCLDGAWLVSDPWCKPGNWVRVRETRLKAGAEEWGRRVYDTAGPGDDPSVPEVLARLAKRLMDRYSPTSPAPWGQGDSDTGGPRPILFTTTNAQPLKGQPVPATGADMGILFNPGLYEDKGIDLYLDQEFKTKVTTTEPGGTLTALGTAARQDSDGHNPDIVAILVSTSKLDTDHNVSQRAILWAKRSSLPANTIATDPEWDSSVWKLLLNAWRT